MTACSQQTASDQTVTAAPTIAPVPIKAYLTKDVAIDIAKRTEPSDQVQWQEPVLKDNESVDPDMKTLRTVWKVQGNYPAGNQIILTVDANNGKVWAVTEIEAQGAGQTALEFKGLHDLHMVDSITGWLLAQSDILQTENGGQNWDSRTPSGFKTEGELRAAFVDAKTAVVVAPLKGKLAVYRSSDGGRNWQLSTIENVGSQEASSFVKTVTFSDHKQGWILVSLDAALGSEAVAAYQTTDGGASWHVVADGKPDGANSNAIPFGGRKTGLSFADGRNGFLAGSDSSDSIYLYASHDSGGTWKRQTVSIPKGLSAEGGSSSSYSPVFFSAKDGILPVVFSINTVVFYVTHDAGASWTPATRVHANSEASFKWSITDDKHIFVTDGHTLFMTKDGAKTWGSTQLETDLKEVEGIEFINERNGFSIHSDRLLKTTDGGHSWTQVSVSMKH
jgi:photosystem II stability/assembly factor-like uncharacterized protein